MDWLRLLLAASFPVVRLPPPRTATVVVLAVAVVVVTVVAVIVRSVAVLMLVDQTGELVLHLGSSSFSGVVSFHGSSYFKATLRLND